MGLKKTSRAMGTHLIKVIYCASPVSSSSLESLETLSGPSEAELLLEERRVPLRRRRGRLMRVHRRRCRRERRGRGRGRHGGHGFLAGLQNILTCAVDTTYI